MGLLHLLDPGLLHLQFMQWNSEAAPPPGAGEGQAEGISPGSRLNIFYSMSDHITVLGTTPVTGIGKPERTIVARISPL
jgi:hypothetical protein